MGQETIVLPADHFKQRVQNQYNNIPLAMVREVIQNSQDAGASRIVFDFTSGFSAIDNGKGMTLPDFRQFYLTLGGSKKDTGSIGGFGAAKEILSFAWDSWTCKGQGFVVSGSGASNPESAKGGIAKGFEVSASDPMFAKFCFASALYNLCALSHLNCSIILQSEDGQTEVKDGRHLRANQFVCSFDFGSLYVHKSNPNDNESTGYLYIRTKGLYTCSEFVGGDYVWYLELTSASQDVLTENRDGLRWKVKDQVRREVNALVKEPSRMEDNPQRVKLVFHVKPEPPKAQPVEDKPNDTAVILTKVDLEQLTDLELENVLDTYHIVLSQEIDKSALTAEQASLLADVSYASPAQQNTSKPTSLQAKPVETQSVQHNSVEYSQDIGEYDMTAVWSNYWRKGFAIASNKDNPNVLNSEQTTLKPSYNKALEVWSKALNMICDCAGLARVVPGLLLSSEPFPALKMGDNNYQIAIVAKVATILESSPFALLDIAMHELAHLERSGHSQEFESARGSIAERIGEQAPAILDTIRQLQAQPAQRGRYWESLDQ